MLKLKSTSYFDFIYYKYSVYILSNVFAKMKAKTMMEVNRQIQYSQKQSMYFILKWQKAFCTPVQMFLHS